MAKDFDVRVEGLKQFRKDLKATDAEAVKGLQKELKAAANIAATEAAVLAPKGTRPIPKSRKPRIRLARSYRAFTRGNIAGVYSTLPQAPVWEFGGTIRPKGAPIEIRKAAPVTRAVERETDAIVEHTADAIEAAARRTGWH